MIDDIAPQGGKRPMEPMPNPRKPIGDLLREYEQKEPENIRVTVHTPDGADRGLVAAEVEHIDLGAESENANDGDSMHENPYQAVDPKTPRQKPWHKVAAWWKARNKWQKIAVASGAVILLVGAGAAAYSVLGSSEPVPVAKKPVPKKVVVKPTTEASKLTGVQVSPDINTRGVIGVMIENSPDARPQSGLADAGVVFEAIAEGGITRFLALYQDNEPDYIGPVRSARPYYIQWLQGFDAAYAHVGGSPDGLSYIKNNNIKDMDQFSNPGPYHRVSNRYTPHNMYSSVIALRELSKSKGYDTHNFTGFARKKAAPSKQPDANTINIGVSSSLYNPSYTYDKEKNVYLRSLAGQAHIDEKSSAQITADVVVALVMDYSIVGGKYSQYNVIGTGAAFVFQDGVVSQVTWQKSSPESQITFKDSGGREFKLNPGKTWVTAVSSPDKVTYAP